MTHLETAIRDAVEKGGYANAIKAPAPSMFKWSEKRLEDGYTEIVNQSVLLDPAFWQALGRARGWKEPGRQCKNCGVRLHNGWEFNWHCLIDHLASGRDVESFFASL